MTIKSIAWEVAIDTPVVILSIIAFYMLRWCMPEPYSVIAAFSLCNLLTSIADMYKRDVRDGYGSAQWKVSSYDS